MVGRRRKTRTGVALAGSHQKCWIRGRNAVLETLRAARWTPLEVLAADRLDRETLDEVRLLAAASDLPVRIQPFETLTDHCRSTEHQGLLAKMPAYPYADLERLLGPQADQTCPPFFVMLNGVQDPHNFGAIIRSVEVFGANGLIVAAQDQAGVTPHVARSSAGAVNHLPIARTTDLLDAIRRLQAGGITVIGAAGEGRQDVHQLDLRRPIAMVIGNEGTGLDAQIRDACDELVRIPQIGRTESLNAAVAAGILCYEVQRQRRLSV